MRIYKVKFYRWNFHTEPKLKQESDVVFRTNLPVEKLTPGELDEIMWDEMWKQNPAWLLCHGPSTIGFSGWSSVMCDNSSIKEIKFIKKPLPDDLTGEGNIATALTFHPLLPSDIRILLEKAHERGLKKR